MHLVVMRPPFSAKLLSSVYYYNDFHILIECVTIVLVFKLLFTLEKYWKNTTLASKFIWPSAYKKTNQNRFSKTLFTLLKMLLQSNPRNFRIMLLIFVTGKQKEK